MSEEEADQVAAEIRRQVKVRGWSARELARQADLTPSVVNDKLEGRRPFNLGDLAAIAPVLGFKDWELLRKARGE